MTGFGDRLRREREMRGVTLEEIAGSTKIGTRSLRALEQEDFEKLPGGIFNKGFVRAYSRFLGLDDDQMVADFDLAWNEHETAKGPTPEPPAEAKPEASTSKLLIVALVLTIAIAAVWYALHRESGAATSEARNADSPEAVSAARQGSATSLSVPPDNPERSPTPADEPASKGPLDTPKPLSNSNSAAISGVAGKTKETSVIAADTAAADSSAPIRLHVFARENSWLSIFADGKNIEQGILNAQSSRAIRAKTEVRLRVGNSGGVDVSFNGQAVNVDGKPKQVKELIFTPAGLHR